MGHSPIIQENVHIAHNIDTTHNVCKTLINQPSNQQRTWENDKQPCYIKVHFLKVHTRLAKLITQPNSDQDTWYRTMVYTEAAPSLHRSNLIQNKCSGMSINLALLGQ